MEVMGHQHMALQQRHQLGAHLHEGWCAGGQGVINSVHGGIGDGHTRIDQGGPLLLLLPIRAEQQHGDLNDAAEMAGAGGLQIQHRKATGSSREQLRQRQGL